MQEHSEQRSSAPDAHPATRHIVGFYERPEELTSAVVSFLGPAVQTGAPVIALLDPHDAPEIEGALGMTALHVRATPEAGGFAVVDAPALLRQIRRAGPQGIGRFQQMMETLIERVTRNHQEVRVVAQMLPHAFDEADIRVALALEEVWERLVKGFDLAALCVYPIVGALPGV